MKPAYSCVQAGLDPDGRLWFVSFTLPHNGIEVKAEGDTKEEAKENLRISLHRALNYSEKHTLNLTKALQALTLSEV